MSKTVTTKTLTAVALCIAVAVALSFVSVLEMPQGGSITAGRMLFLALPAYWFGPGVGIIAGVAYGLIDLLLEPEIYHPVQVIMDYPLAFAMFGLAGFLRGDKAGSLSLVYVMGVLGRWLVASVSGAVFFAEYAGDQNPFIYSATYNIAYIGAEGFLTLVLISIPALQDALRRVGEALRKPLGVQP